MLSVILPSYNEEKMISIAAERLAAILEGAGIDYELLFVDDGSKDSTWQMIEQRRRKQPPCGGHTLQPELRQGIGHVRRAGKGPGRLLRRH